jgi:hypothetical protein
LRLVEEVYLKAEKDEICQKCGIDIPKGTNHLLETYGLTSKKMDL